MVRDGIYYGLALIAAAALVAWLTVPALAAIPLLLAAFFLWFFRDPERAIPAIAGAVVSPADGKVTSISVVEENGQKQTHISIFLNVFDVHVNRTPVGGVIRTVKYQKGRFLAAQQERCSAENEQNVITVETEDGLHVTFKQIAGLIARRIVFTKQPGDVVAKGERIGLMKFGSRMDVLFGPEWEILVQAGQRVAAGSSVIARRRELESLLAGAAEAEAHGT